MRAPVLEVRLQSRFDSLIGAAKAALPSDFCFQAFGVHNAIWAAEYIRPYYDMIFITVANKINKAAMWQPC